MNTNPRIFPGRQAGGIWLPVLVVLILGAGAYYYFNVYQKEEPVALVEAPILPAEPPPLPVEEAAVTEDPSGDVEVEIQDDPEQVEEILQAPVVALSDEEAQQAATNLLGEDAVRNYLVSEGLISRLVAMIDALSGRQLPGNIIPVHGPGGEMQATSDGQTEEINPETGLPDPLYRMDPVNFQRYTPQVEIIEAIDMEELVQSYHLYYPQLQKAYRELGYADGSFEDRLLEVIAELLATPEPEEPLVLVRPEAYYEFADPRYEALTAGQKILLRSGPSNTARIKDVLKAFQSAIQTQRE